MKPGRLRVNLLWFAALAFLFKCLLAAHLPLFVDEAFYAWEGRRLDWAYSDLPGATAWLSRLGAELGRCLGSDSLLALRAPFLLLGALLPWLAWRIARRAFGTASDAAGGLEAIATDADADARARAFVGYRHADHAALLVMLMPLSGLLGVMALPDVPLVLAGLLSVDAWLRLRERVDLPALATLALGLVLGALSHYRFAGMLVAALAGIALDRRAWPLLRDRRVLSVLLLGALAWLPLLAWNLQHDDAGIAFQLRERNPWRFDPAGLAWLPIQMLVVTPPLFVLLLATLRACWSRRREDAAWALFAGLGTFAVPALFVLGFFADRQRVSFHWPIFGWIVLACAAPTVLRRWPRIARGSVWVTAALGLLLAGAFLAAASVAPGRAWLADTRLYPKDFAGADALATWVRAQPSRAGSAWIAGDFGTGAQLAHALDTDAIRVLDDPANRKHGRAAQLRAWHLRADPAWLRAVGEGRARPARLVVEDSATPMKSRLALYHARCALFGEMPVPRMLSVDGGNKRYFLYDFAGVPAAAPAHAARCASPALAWIDAPAPGARVGTELSVRGWAFKDGAGLRRVDVLLDGRVLGTAIRGDAMPGVRDYWRISSDPDQPRVGFHASLDLRGVAPGVHRLGLRLQGADGSIEDWPTQALRVTP
jgi:4-amino-4-deoxy-L-arabinose transferase-like glycosyltransferase